jgi:hypothetical protein
MLVLLVVAIQPTDNYWVVRSIPDDTSDEPTGGCLTPSGLLEPQTRRGPLLDL